MNARTLIELVAGGALCAGGLAVGYKLEQPKTIPETQAPEVRQADGSLVLARAPDANAKPLQALPAGSTLERVVRVTVAPKAPPTPASPGAPASCPPVSVDMSLVKNQDGTQRVVASSPDGEVVGGVDVPVVPATVMPVHKWRAGLTTNPLHPQAVGAYVDRTVGPLVIGAEVNRVYVHGGYGVEARVRLGVEF